jgi:hypothetical protein
MTIELTYGFEPKNPIRKSGAPARYTRTFAAALALPFPEWLRLLQSDVIGPTEKAKIHSLASAFKRHLPELSVQCVGEAPYIYIRLREPADSTAALALAAARQAAKQAAASAPPPFVPPSEAVTKPKAP